MTWSLLLAALVLAPIAAITYAVWAYRKSIAQKAIASSQRYQELLAADAPVAGEVASVSASAPATAQGVAAYSGKERLLSPPQTLLYYVLKAGLPDHEIFAQVNLAAVVDAPQTVRGYGRDQLQRRLAWHYVDFLVCDKSTRIVAVAEFETATENANFKAACLKAAGIRHVLIKPTAIPKRDAVRALILTTG